MKNLSLFTILGNYGKYQKRKGSSLLTIKKYHGNLLNIFIHCGKVQQRQTITTKEIEHCIYTQKRKATTKATYIFEMRSFLKFCQMQNIPIDNPQKLLYQRPLRKEARFLQALEISKILRYVEKRLRDKAVILLLLTTGLRLSELCSLSKKQLQNATMVGNVYQINVLGKGKKLRSIFLPIPTREVCRRLKIANTPSLLGIKKWKVQYLIKTIRKATKVRFSAHTLRHTYLSHLARNGADLWKIQKIAGHASIQTTSLYLHCSNKELASTAGLATNLIENEKNAPKEM